MSDWLSGSKSVIRSCSTGGGSIGLRSFPSGPALAARGCCLMCKKILDDIFDEVAECRDEKVG